MGWIRKNHGQIKVPLNDYIEKLIVAELKKVSHDDITLCIGTDSQKRKKKGIRGYQYATVIVLVTKTKGGKIIYKKEFKPNKLNLVERMCDEVNMSIICAYELKEIIDKYNINIEIHADINKNPKYKSEKALTSAINHIMSMSGYFSNYSYKVKPDAWASSYGADRICKK